MINVLFFLVYLFVLAVVDIIFIVYIFSRHIFDGGDERSPYTLLGLFFGLALIFCFFKYIIDGIISPWFTFLLMNSCLIYISYMIRSRLYGFVTHKIPQNFKNILLMFYLFIFSFFLLISLINYEIVTFPVLPFSMMNRIMIFSEAVSYRYSSFSDIIIIISYLISLATLLIFDHVEGRKKSFIWDLFHFMMVIVAFIKIFEIQLNIVVEFIVTVAFFTFPLLYVFKESMSIIRKSNESDTRVKVIKRIIKNYRTKTTTTPKDDFQLSYIASLLENDATLSNIVFGHHIFFDESYQKVYDKIRSFYQKSE
jgi:hypothetical protein